MHPVFVSLKSCQQQAASARLLISHDGAFASDFHIQLRQFKAVIGFQHGFQPLLGFWRGGFAHQEAHRLVLASPHTTPKLMQLRQPELLSFHYHHSCGVGHIHAYFYNSGGHERIQLAAAELLHDSFFFFRL